MIAAVILTAAIIGITIWEFKRAPEGWECPRCKGEVIESNVCYWCGYRRNR
jgi:hypothetical protein